MGVVCNISLCYGFAYIGQTGRCLNDQENMLIRIHSGVSTVGTCQWIARTAVAILCCGIPRLLVERKTGWREKLLRRHLFTALEKSYALFIRHLWSGKNNLVSFIQGGILRLSLHWKVGHSVVLSSRRSGGLSVLFVVVVSMISLS